MTNYEVADKVLGELRNDANLDSLQMQDVQDYMDNNDTLPIGNRIMKWSVVVYFDNGKSLTIQRRSAWSI